MEPNHNSFEVSAELPQPQEVNGQTLPEHSPAPQPEKRGLQAPAAAPPASQPGPAVTGDPQALQVSGGTPQPAVQNGGATAGLMADDADLIEKEWVVKAKAIVMQTKDDPHAQNREMNKVKADYLKKRYNKDLKISEG